MNKNTNPKGDRLYHHGRGNPPVVALYFMVVPYCGIQGGHGNTARTFREFIDFYVL